MAGSPPGAVPGQVLQQLVSLVVREIGEERGVLKVGSVNGINIESVVIATLGAIAVLLVVNFATRSRGLRLR